MSELSKLLVEAIKRSKSSLHESPERRLLREIVNGGWCLSRELLYRAHALLAQPEGQNNAAPQGSATPVQSPPRDSDVAPAVAAPSEKLSPGHEYPHHGYDCKVCYPNGAPSEKPQLSATPRTNKARAYIAADGSISGVLDDMAALELALSEANKRIAKLVSISNVNGDWTLTVHQLREEIAALRSATAPLDELDRRLSERANRYMGTVEDYYLHGLWIAREEIKSLRAADNRVEREGKG